MPRLAHTPASPAPHCRPDPPPYRVRAIVHDVMEQQSINKVLRKMVGVLVLIVVLTLVAMFGVSLAAGEALKESKVSGSVMTTLGGAALQVDTVESRKTLWHVGSASTNHLAKLKTITFYMDMTADASMNGWVEATFQVRRWGQPTLSAHHGPCWRQSEPFAHPSPPRRPRLCGLTRAPPFLAQTRSPAPTRGLPTWRRSRRRPARR